MADMAVAERREKLAGSSGGGSTVTVKPAPPAERLVLRASEDALNSLSRALGVTLPKRPKQSARSKSGKRAALWLGPDEWLVIDADGAGLMGDAAKAKALHSAVDVSHRNVGIMVEGEGAEACLAAGCPQDLSLAAFPVDACSRTVLGKVEIVLWRTDEQVFRVEVWRSFADYAFAFLAEAARDV
ncbi:sarcosine oxidase subunit gamma family protein [Nitratireductor mangrovi]|uniref:Sarcosine oxidase subunit gamma family protein n=1 Tax=Nitratireductor mangrovi TaxID=2599600 RepID=A0A5B8L5D4_9HYPH|nr:sarcosine oxidase subunit gamma [Nitratireductor mangrovi]QDZ03114.1 sarcosine oxidase subunit gamma family protein [Nitratireductor mangrovi]